MKQNAKSFRPESGEKLMERQDESMKTSRIVLAGLGVTGVILCAFRIRVGILFLIMFALLGWGIYSRIRSRQRELAKIADPAAFGRQMANAAEYASFGLFLTDEYVVLEHPGFRVYPLKDMAKFEVGIGGGMHKALFLTDPAGVRHKIAEVSKGSGSQSEFDGLYQKIRDYFHARDDAAAAE